MKIICIVPVYNDWPSLERLVSEIETTVVQKGDEVEIVIVNDGSSEQVKPELFPASIPVKVINLNLNVGHQRAICIGLSFVYDTYDHYDVVVVMDSDGEDKPSDIRQLASEAQNHGFSKIIFAKRKRRTERMIFKIFYYLYRFVFNVLTGKLISFGNFSCIPQNLLNSIVSSPASWNHYSGSILKSKLPYETISLDRGERYFGKSKMGLMNLIIHGLSSISIYLEVVSVRLLIFSFLGMLLALSSILFVFSIRLFTDYAIPGWASNISLLIFNILIQFFVISLVIVLLILFNRNNLQPAPKNFYREFIHSII